MKRGFSADLENTVWYARIKTRVERCFSAVGLERKELNAARALQKRVCQAVGEPFDSTV